MFRVIILSKAPVEGHVKTRLMPHYTAKEAVELHKLMVSSVLNKACTVFDDVWLAVDDTEHTFFIDLQRKFSFKLCNQGSGDLGQRLKLLSNTSFREDKVPIMFLGTDSPHVSSERYTDCQRHLISHDIVIGAVEDGGYDLIALKKFTPEIFDYITWGTSHVFDETINNINGMKLSFKVLDSSFDLDRPEDLARAPAHTW